MRATEEQEYTEFIKARQPALRRLAYHLCGDSHQADDLVQETAVKLYVRWPVTDVRNLDAYVNAILVRTFLDERRRGWWRVRLFGGVLADRVHEGGSDADARTTVRAALATLPSRQQAVLVLRFLCDLPVTEVATLLNCSPGTVKSQTAHGLEAMRRRLGERFETFTESPTDTGAAR
ncbi:SigE family RNA polymerase sigma factor [Actinoplanes sp. NPDC049548]|uniref:SigE family RNA polymerase sigma factor n=1 Tax=Actinoplanes sp. NPDC049548 TaxID=3155152 RepID=UPI0034188349